VLQQKRKENDVPNTPDMGKRARPTLDGDGFVDADKVLNDMMIKPTPKASEKRARGAQQTPSMMGMRARVIGQTPSGAAFSIGTPGKFHHSPVGRKTAAAYVAQQQQQQQQQQVAAHDAAPRTASKQTRTQARVNKPASPQHNAADADDDDNGATMQTVTKFALVVLLSAH
jgi:hypothetical protein